MSPGDSVLRLAERIETLAERVPNQEQLAKALLGVFTDFGYEVAAWQPSRIALLVTSLRRLASNINPLKED